MRWFIIMITAVFSSTHLVGCGGGDSSSPSEAQIESLMRKEIAEDSRGDLALKSLKKTDGSATPSLGLYIAFFDAEIEAVNDADWEIGSSSKERSSKFKTSRGSTRALVGKGQVIKVHGIQRMHQTENGWGAEGDASVWLAEPLNAATSDAAPARSGSAEPTGNTSAAPADALAARGIESGLSSAESKALMADPKVLASMTKLRSLAAATEELRAKNRELAIKKEKVRRIDVDNLVASGVITAEEATSPFGSKTPGFAMAWWVRPQGDAPDTLWAYDKLSYSDAPAVVVMFVDGACAVMKKEAFDRIARDFIKQAS